MKKRIAVIQNNQVLYHKIGIAAGFWQRFLGLMGKQKWGDEEGLFLLHCESIHTCFMRFPIDVAYLDGDFQVLECETVYPWRIGSLVKGTRHILELPAHTGNRLIKGIPITLLPEDSMEFDEESQERGSSNARER